MGVAPKRRRVPVAHAPSLDREARQVAGTTIRRAKRRLRFVRFLLWLGAVGNALGGLLLLNYGDTLLGGISLALAAVFAAGALTLHRFPVGWTVGLAGFQTLSVALAVLDGDLPALGIFIAALLWGAVPVTARATRIVRQHADVFDEDALRLGYSATAPKGETRQRAEQRDREARRKRLATLAWVVGAVAAVGVGGTLAIRAATKPRPLPPRLEAFRAALARGDADGAEALCSATYRGGSWEKAQAILERESWLPGGVALGAPITKREGDHSVEVHFPLPRGLMKTIWQLEGRDWVLDGVIFSGVRER